MPHKGESASFFSLHFYCNSQAGLPLPPPFLPPLSPVPSPTATPGELGRRSFHAGAQTLYFQRKPASEGDGRRAGAAQGSGRAAGSLPAPARAELAGRTETPGASEAAAPGPSVAKCSWPAGEDEEALRRPRPGNGCRDQPPAAALSSRGPSERAESGRAEEAPGEPARRAAARSPALWLCAALRRGTKSAGTRAPRGTAPAASPSRVHRQRQSHAAGGEKERVSGEEATRPKRSNARSEGAQSGAGLSASIKPPGCCPQLERRARNLKTLCFPGFPQPPPSPCESWGLPCPSVPSARWVFFLVFL